MLTTLILLCAQTPVQHELDLIPFEHLINRKVEVEQLRQDRLFLDLVISGTQAEMVSMQTANGVLHFGNQKSRGPFRGSKDILNSIQTYMEPAFEDKRESLKISQSTGGRVLLAYLQPSQSKWIRDFFALQEETESWTALVSAHIFIGGSEWLDANGFEGQATPFIDASVMEDVLKAMRSSSQQELASPRILTNPGMDGSLSILTEFSYVDKWEERTVQPGDVTVLDPSVETVEEGLTLDVRVLQVGENQYGIAISYQLLDLIHPMKTQEVMLGGVACVTASPEVITTSLESNLVIPNGGGAVYRTTRSSDQKEIVLVLQFQRQEVTDEK